MASRKIERHRQDPLIALTISAKEFSEYLLWPDMYRGLHNAGAVCVSIDTTVTGLPITEIIENVSGLIIGGGGDVDPRFYKGSADDPALSGVHTERDENELAFLHEALARQIPVLGICRGAQLINVSRGGTLIGDIERDVAGAIEHRGNESELDQAIHRVDLDSHSSLSELLGDTHSIEVNSGHHQAVKKLGEHLKAVAWSPDRLVEGIESSIPDERLFGVQWHPENLWANQEHAQLLLSNFVDLCRQPR